MRNVYKLVYIIIGFMLILGVASAATLNVPTQYKTIQKAVNAAQNGDTINVAAGTYKEKVIIADKYLSFVGAKSKYPTVYGFEMSHTADKLGGANINGFKITKTGVRGEYLGLNTIRNNYFYNCDLNGGDTTWANNIIMNNKFTNGGVYLWEGNTDNIVVGNTFYKSKIGLSLRYSATCKQISGNTFSNCLVGVRVRIIPDVLRGNKYIHNKINIQTGNY